MHMNKRLAITITAALALVFAVAAITSPTPAREGVSLRGIDVFNSKPFQCGKQFHMKWVNEIGDIQIYIAQIWMGMYVGNVSDFGYQVNRLSDGSLIFRGNWDHYQDPTGIDGQLHTMNFTPNYMELKAGDALEFWYDCQTKGDTGHAVVTIWYGE